MIDYTLIATAYNDEAEIERYMDNILEQKFLPREIIIADGGSTDRTVILLEKYKEKTDIPVIIISGKRLNISEGYNKAIKKCTSEYIGITGIGNLYEKDFFYNLSIAIESNNYDFVYSLIYGLDINKFSVLYNKAFLNNNQGMYQDFATNHGVLIRKDIFAEYGYFYEKFIYAGEDTEFFRYLNRRGCKSKCIDSAKVFWITPATCKEYLKQVRNYMIGHMQITTAWKLLKKYDPQIVLIVTVILSAAEIKLMLIPLIVLLLFIGKYRSIEIGLFKFCHHFLSLYYLIRNYKYFGDSYKVKRDSK